MSDLKRTQSLTVLPSITYDRYGDIYYHSKAAEAPHAYTVRRVATVPDLTSPSSWRYSPNPNRRYYADSDLWSDYKWDRRYYSRPLYWPHSAWPNRKYYALDPPYSLWWNYPSLSWYSRHSRYSDFDYVDPLVWRRFRDPYYDRPVWYPYRPWFYESLNMQRAADMCKRRLISFDTYNRYWLNPYYWERKTFYDYGPYTPPSWPGSPRRYYFSYNVL